MWKLCLTVSLGIIMLVYLDHLAWTRLRPEKNIGSNSGIFSVFDTFIEKYMGDTLKAQDLREQFEKAVGDGAIASSALAYYDSLKTTNRPTRELRTVLDSAIGRVSVTSRNGDVIRLKNEMTDFLIKQKDNAALTLHLENLLETATVQPINLKLFIDTIRSIGRTDNQSIMYQLTPELFTRLSYEERLEILKELEVVFMAAVPRKDRSNRELIGQDKNITYGFLFADAAVELEKRHTAELLLAERKPTINHLLATTSDGMRNADILEKFYHDLPDMHEEFVNETYATLLQLANIGAMPRFYQLYNCMLQTVPTIPAYQGERFQAITAAASSYYLVQGARDKWQDFVEKSLNLAPQDWFYENYYQGEIWARTGEVGISPRPLFVIPYLPDQELIIDGELDDSVYSTIDQVPGDFYRSFPNSSKQLSAADNFMTPEITMFYNDKGIYIGAAITEFNFDTLRVNLPPGFNEDIYTNDCLELVLDIERNGRETYHYVVTPKGAFATIKQVDQRYRPGVVQRQNPGVFIFPEAGKLYPIQTASIIYTEVFYLEIFIPAEQLPLPLDQLAGKLLGGNIRRNRYYNASPYSKPTREVLSWVPNRVEFTPYTLGFIRFQGKE